MRSTLALGLQVRNQVGDRIEIGTSKPAPSGPSKGSATKKTIKEESLAKDGHKKRGATDDDDGKGSKVHKKGHVADGAGQPGGGTRTWMARFGLP